MSAPEFSAADAVAIVTLCNEAEQPGMAAELIRAGATVDEARERLDLAGGIRAMVALASHGSPAIGVDFAEKAIAARMSISAVRKALCDAAADAADASVLVTSKPRNAGTPGR